MTRIVLFVLFLSLSAHAAKNDGCQGDLFSKPMSARRSEKPAFERFEDLVFMQRELWSLEAQPAKQEAAEHLRRRMTTQLMISKRRQKAATIGRHTLFKATDLSYFVFRESSSGFKEHLAYELNEALGRPVHMPLTVSQLDGSNQLWMFYDFKDEILSEAEDRDLSKAIAADADLYLFNFLTANTDQHPGNLILDRDHGVVVFDFSSAFRFSVQNYIYWSQSKEARTKELEEITQADVVKILREKLASAKFDWATGLARLASYDESPIRNRLGPIEARELKARICFLRAVVYGSNPATCNAL